MPNNSKESENIKISDSQTIVEQLKTTLKQIYYKELPLDHLVFLYTAFAGIFMSIFGLGYNIVKGLGVFTWPVLISYLIVSISSVLYSVIKKRWYGAAIIVIGSSVYFLIPFLWFTIGGATGPTAAIMLTGGLCITFVFKGKVRTVMDQYVRVRDEKTRLVNRLEYLSLTDSLTGLYNRRYLWASIDEEMRRAYETGSQLTLCILGIDHFKKVNDTYGHEYGDEVLFNIAQIMKAGLTNEEIFGRYGGEEFVILFPEKTPAQAFPIVQTLANYIREHGWPHGKPVTISGGLSAYVPGISYSNFVEAADKNLYRAKRGGRDRIIY